MIDFAGFSLLGILFASLIAFALAIEFGRYLGRRARSAGGEHVSTLEGAVLGLLALMIGFTFAMSLSRHEARREAVLSEANSIVSAAMLARLLPEPRNIEALTLLSDYTGIRLSLKAQFLTPDSLRAAVERSNVIQEKLWRLGIGLADTDNAMVPTGLFIQSLGQVFDNQTSRVAALRSHVPDIVLLGLYGIAVTAIGLLGYGSGVRPYQPRLPAYLVGSLIALVMLLIHDLDRPGSGFIHVSQLPMEEAAEAIAEQLGRPR